MCLIIKNINQLVHFNKWPSQLFLHCFYLDDVHLYHGHPNPPGWYSIIASCIFANFGHRILWKFKFIEYILRTWYKYKSGSNMTFFKCLEYTPVVKYRYIVWTVRIVLPCHMLFSMNEYSMLLNNDVRI